MMRIDALSLLLVVLHGSLAAAWLEKLKWFWKESGDGPAVAQRCAYAALLSDSAPPRDGFIQRAAAFTAAVKLAEPACDALALVEDHLWPLLSADLALSGLSARRLGLPVPLSDVADQDLQRAVLTGSGWDLLGLSVLNLTEYDRVTVCGALDLLPVANAATTAAELLLPKGEWALALAEPLNGRMRRFRKPRRALLAAAAAGGAAAATAAFPYTYFVVRPNASVFRAVVAQLSKPNSANWLFNNVKGINANPERVKYEAARSRAAKSAPAFRNAVIAANVPATTLRIAACGVGVTGKSGGSGSGLCYDTYEEEPAAAALLTMPAAKQSNTNSTSVRNYNRRSDITSKERRRKRSSSEGVAALLVAAAMPSDICGTAVATKEELQEEGKKGGGYINNDKASEWLSALRKTDLVERACALRRSNNNASLTWASPGGRRTRNGNGKAAANLSSSYSNSTSNLKGPKLVWLPQPAKNITLTAGDLAMMQYFYFADVKRKVLLLAIPKVGCTQFSKLFLRMFGSNDWNTPHTYRVHMHEDRRHFYASEMSPAKVTAIFNDPTWTRVVFLRDPASRLLSAYLDKFIFKKSYGKMLFHRPVSLSLLVDLLQPNARKAHAGEHQDKLMQLSYATNPHWRPQELFFLKGARILPYFNAVGLLEHGEAHVREFMVKAGLWEEFGASGWGKDGKSAFFAPEAGSEHATAAVQKEDMYFDEGLRAKVRRAYRQDYRLVERFYPAGA